MEAREYITIEVEAWRKWTNSEGRPAESEVRYLLKQEVERKDFDLRAVIQAVNFPEQLDLRRLAAQYADTPHLEDPDEVMDSLSMKQAEVRIAIVLDRLDPTHAIANHRQAAARILLEIFPGYRTEQEKQNRLRPEDGPRA